MSTGVTLRENHLKVLRNGVILDSVACFVGNRRSLNASAEKREVTRHILELIESRLRAQDFFSVTANLRGESELEVARALLAAPATRGMRGPTVSRVFTASELDGAAGGAHWFAATIIVGANTLQAAIDHLRAVGGSGMSVVPVRYLFDAHSHAFEGAMKVLGLRR